MKIGFTGTQKGMNGNQAEKLLLLLEYLKVSEFHHGDCIGCDAEAHNTVMLNHRLLGEIPIHIHPPENGSKRAFCEGAEITYDARDYLTRNRSIVAMTRRLIAVPCTEREMLRSGTWSTVRHAKKLKRGLWIIPPNGLIKTFNVPLSEVVAFTQKVL